MGEGETLSGLTPRGTAKERFLEERGSVVDSPAEAIRAADLDDFEPFYLGWEIARCAGGLVDDERRAVAALAAACIA